VLAVIAGLARWRREAHAVIALQLGCAIVTLALALPVELTGWPLRAGWLVLALVATVIARRADVRFTPLALLLVLAAYAEHGTPAAQLVCVLAMFAVERGHAANESPFRTFAIAGVTLGLLDLALLALPSGFHTLGWVGASFALFAVGFGLELRSYRWAGFAALAASAARLLAIELRTFTPNQRILTFVLAGVAMLSVSFVYARRKD
jgi:hypothetical protein